MRLIRAVIVHGLDKFLFVFDFCRRFADLADSDPIVLTWKAMLDKKLTCEHLDAGVTQISLPEGLKWFFEFREPSLLARACAPLLFDRVLSLQSMFRPKTIGVLLTGSPGIGKSWFLMYTMYRLAAEPSVPTIILHSAKRAAAHWFRPDGTVATNSNPHGEDLARISDEKSWYLFDANENEIECFPIEAFTLVASSPNRRHYKGFKKQMGTVKLCMPPWTLDELLAVKHLFFYIAADLATENRGKGEEEKRSEVDVVRERYEMAGGIPRTVFTTANEYGSFLRNQSNQSSYLSFDGISDLLTSNVICDEGGNRLSHAIVKNELGDDDNGRFVVVKLSFISKSVAKLFLQAKYGTAAAGYRDAMRSALSWHPAAGGQIFEAGFHKLVELGCAVKLRCVTVNNGKRVATLDLDVEKIKYRQCANPESEAKSALKEGLNYYVVPESPRHAFIDSILVTGGAVWCIQVTVASQRKDFSDEKLQAYFRENFGDTSNVRFLFVVPSLEHFKAPSSYYLAEFNFSENERQPPIQFSGGASSSVEPPQV